MNFDDERKKLFDEVWEEPMTTVAKRYGLSDNGLRKRCIKLEIPLPPVGHWAKLQAGKESISKPKLPPLKIIQQKIYENETKQYQTIEIADIENKPDDELEELDGIELLTPESKEKFMKWCSKIQVPRKIEHFNPLIIDYQNEIEYRKARDKEHKFHDIFKYYYSIDMVMQSKIKYRDNKAVLPISVSDKHANRAFRIIDTFINLVNELDGKVVVEHGQKDYATFNLFNHTFTLQMTETMVKRRSLSSGTQAEKTIKNFRPLYEKVPSGVFEIEFREVLGHWDKEKTAKTLRFMDSIEIPIEKQLGDIFISLFKTANEAKIARFLAEREYKQKAKEQQCLREIEEKRRKNAQEVEERNRRKQHLFENIENQMEDWFKSQRLRRYVDELEKFTSEIDEVATKELLVKYIGYVKQHAEKCNPITDILNEINAIGILNPPE